MRVALVNPPFANFRRPSIALAQLRSVCQAQVPGVTIDIHNINLDCVPLIGSDWYMEVSDGFQSWTGIGDWLFRPLAFPTAEDNAESYLPWLLAQAPTVTDSVRRGSSGFDTETILEARRRLCEALPGLVRQRALDQYDLVGVTSMFAQTLPALAILRLIKEANSQVTTALGGANCESPMGEALLERFDFVDVVFSGRATSSFPAFLRELKRYGCPEAVPDIAGALRRDPPPASADAATPQPDETAVGPAAIAVDYDDFIEATAAAPFDVDVVIPFETSSGCWWGERSHCTFCGLNSRTMAYHALPPSVAVDHIQALVDRYGDVCKTFEATDNILSLSYFDEMLPKLRIPPDVTLFYEIKANLSPAHLKRLAAARVLRIQPGIEALSSEAVKLLRKGVDAGRNVAVLRNCRSEGISVDWNLLVGIPGESAHFYTHFLEQAPKLLHLEPPAGAFEVRYDRYSPYFTYPDHFGIEPVPFEFYDYLYPMERAWIERIAYCFRDDPARPRLSADIVHLIGAIRETIRMWHERWQAAPAPFLELTEDSSGPLVRDGRQQSRTETIRCSAAEVHALGYLSRPRKRRQLIQELVKAGWDEALGIETVSAIHRRGWTFDEGELMTSLVLCPADGVQAKDRQREPTVAASG